MLAGCGHAKGEVTMRRWSISQVTTLNWDFGQDVSHYAATGVPGIGVFRDKLERFGTEAGISLLLDSPLQVASLVDVFPLVHPMRSQVKMAVQDVLDRIELARRIRTDCVAVLTGEPAGFFMSLDLARQLVIEALKEAAPAAEAAGIRLALEPISARYPGYSFLHSIPDALEIIDAVGSPNVGMCFDTDHLYETPNLLADIQRAGDRIFSVQINDMPAEPGPGLARMPLGRGVIPLKEILHAIDGAGYDGFYDIELFSPEVWEMDYGQLLEECKTGFAEIW
jgi:sugar phosphate isomerase/epimerase